MVSILTAAKEFRISYSTHPVSNVMHADLATFGREKHIPVYTLGSSMKDSDLESKVFADQPDFVLVAGWYHMIPASWLARSQILGLHASLLPKYRGGAPLVWAMINGETTTGLSLFQMDRGVDAGPVFSTREIPIRDGDEISDLLARVENASMDIIRHDFPRIASGELKGEAQPAGSFAVWPQRSPAAGKIDWSESADSIVRFVRAQTSPYPGAFTLIDTQKISIWSCQQSTGMAVAAAPGTIKKSAGNFHIRAADSWIRLINFDFQGDRNHADKLLAEQAKILGEVDYP